jgi:hypothetical protein
MIREFIIAGLRIKAIRHGQFTSLLIQDAGGETVFRGAIIFRFWPKIKAALDSVGQVHGLEP